MYRLVHEDFTTTKQRRTRLEIRIRARSYLLIAWLCLLLAGSPTVGWSQAEYFSKNSGDRLLVRIQVWGDVALPGVHHVPDTTSLSGVIGLAGGPKGDIEDVEITFRRGKDRKTYKVTGSDILSSPTMTGQIMQTGDVVYVESGSGSEELLRNLGIVTAVTGTITSLAVVYFLFSGDGK